MDEVQYLYTWLKPIFFNNKKQELMKTSNKSKCNEKRQFSGLVWCDDHTDVWTGTCDRLVGPRITTQVHPNTVEFSGSGKCCDYLYLVCWSNDGGLNGLMVELNGLGNKILSGSLNWEVFATGNDYDVQTSRPSRALVESQLIRANCDGWKQTTIGPTNNSPAPFPNVPAINGSANFIWWDSGLDPNPGAPFTGFNHNEFLIFRYPLKKLFKEECIDCSCEECGCDCDCSCAGCNKDAYAQNDELIQRAKAKSNTILSDVNCPPPFPGDCSNQVINGQANLEPCFYFHWGDSPTDPIEEHDTEVFYLTVCNNFTDVQYKGLRITKVTLIPNIHPLDSIQIVPDRFICLDCLEPCSCQTREFALITRANNIAGNYTLEVEYCYEEIVIASSGANGKVTFPVVITRD